MDDKQELYCLRAAAGMMRHRQQSVNWMPMADPWVFNFYVSAFEECMIYRLEVHQ